MLKARRLSFAAVGGVLLSFVASSAPAAILPVSGTVAISIAFFPQVTLSGSGMGSSVGGGIASHPVLAVPGASVPVIPTYFGIALVTLPPGASFPAGVGGGVTGLAGTAFFFAGQGTPAGSVPLGPVGGGGMTPILLGPVTGTLTGATWQGAGASGTPIQYSSMGQALAIAITATATGYDNRTAGGVGVVQFVAPATGSINIFGAFPVFGVLTLSYTPEPGTIVLLGSGIAGLAAFGRRKQRRQGAPRVSPPEWRAS